MTNTTTQKLSTFSKSTIIGISATAADLLTLFILVDLLKISPQWANLPALMMGVGIQFFGNKFFAFENRDKAWLKQGLLFSLVEGGTLALNAGLFHYLVVVHEFPHLITRLGVGLIVYLFFSYPLWKSVFGKTESI